MTSFDLGYVIGYVEGEGCFTLASKQYPCISVTQKDPETLYNLQKLIGGKVYGPPSQSCHRLFINGKAARQLMAEWYPYLSSRRQARILEILDVWHNRNVKWRVATR